MWLTKKKFEALKEEARQDALDALKEELKWHKKMVIEEIRNYAEDRAFILDETERKQIEQVANTSARHFLIDLADMPPQDFIEKLVARINNVQLDK
jgi:hypothetical protein